MTLVEQFLREGLFSKKKKEDFKLDLNKEYTIFINDDYGTEYAEVILYSFTFGSEDKPAAYFEIYTVDDYSVKGMFTSSMTDGKLVYEYETLGSDLDKAYPIMKNFKLGLRGPEPVSKEEIEWLKKYDVEEQILRNKEFAKCILTVAYASWDETTLDEAEEKL